MGEKKKGDKKAKRRKYVQVALSSATDTLIEACVARGEESDLVVLFLRFSFHFAPKRPPSARHTLHGLPHGLLTFGILYICPWR